MNHPLKSPGIDEQRIGDELFLYGRDGEKLTVLNITAMLIWSLCDGHHDTDAMTEVLRDIMPDADPETLRGDIETTLQHFAENGLVRHTSV